ncbi:MAG: glutamate formimidoyltransferase [Candidatus Poseidoniaceae archaeon]|nr:glutamate formimidoyltransferase [Candidatus Poseidoniaceae archaeon]
MAGALVECVPNISEGVNQPLINSIVDAARGVEGARVLSSEADADYNRTVITIAGEPRAVSQSVFQLIREACASIDMKQHSGNHARLGAVDVCPFVPLSGITMEECAGLAVSLAQRVSTELNLPAFLYGAAASSEERRNHSILRRGQYEGLQARMSPEQDTIHSHETRLPDYGPSTWSDDVARTGAIIIGARDILVAYNVNIDEADATVSTIIGKVIRQSGPVIKNGDGERLSISGMLPRVQGMGFPLEEHGISQVSMNLQDISVTPMHVAYEAIKWIAEGHGVKVTGSELVGLAPLKAFIEAGIWYAPNANGDSELISAAVKGMGLDDISPFVAEERIIEMALRGGA